MFKSSLKITVLALIIFGGFSLISAPKAAAATCAGAPDRQHWGVDSVGENAGALAGAVVHASVGTYANADNTTASSTRPSNYGTDLNIPFTLHASNTAEGNNRIFLWPSGVNGRADHVDTSTGANFIDDATLTFPQCDGWAIFGPGAVVNGHNLMGNGWVLDCGTALGAGYVSTRYWVTTSSAPNGQNGYWEVAIEGQGSTNINNAGPGNGQSYFTVTNGATSYVNLIWHPSAWTTNANSTVNTPTASPGQTVTFTHTISTTGGQSSYSWTVVRKYPNDSGPVVARNGNGSGTTTQSITYTIPGGATDGQQYCQRISFNNSQGGSPASGSSSNACVTVSTHPCTAGCGQCGNPACTPKQPACTSVTLNPTADRLKYVSISGTDADVTNAPSAGLGPSDDSKTWTFNAINQWVTITYMVYDKGTNSAGKTTWTLENPDGKGYTNQAMLQCYHASCSIAHVIPDGLGPDGTVVAGHQFTLQVQVKNDNPYESAETLPANFDGYDFSITEHAENGHDYVHNPTGFSLNPPPPAGDGSYVEGTLFINFTAPSKIPTNNGGQMHISLYPEYEKSGSSFSLGGGDCNTDVPIYQHFSDTVAATSTPSGQEADAPTSYNYGATMSISEDNNDTQSVSMPVSASFYKKAVSGATTSINSFNNPGGSPAYTVPSPSGGDGIWSGSYTLPAGPYNAGDEYCSTVTAAYNSGFVGPGGDIKGGVPLATDTSCPRITNEPYFKVTNSSVIAGGDFDKCTTAGGTLAGYNNNTDAGSLVDHGASVQLGALAIIPSGISGVASGQNLGTTGSGGQGAMRLTFANNTSKGAPYTAGTDTPTLGGNAGTCQTLTNVTPDRPTSPLPGTDLSALASGEYTTGNVSIGTPGTTQTMTDNQVEIFSTGNVYIGSNIIYDNSGAVSGTVPSLMIHATGNVYIDPAVSNLSGIYIAQQKIKDDGSADTTTGKIYTCGTSSFTPLQTSGSPNIYNNCHNQLVVYGSFVADQVNLMRTFGSLRDETPNPPTGSVGGTPAEPWGLYWTHSGAIPAGYNCANITDNSTSHDTTQYDNYLCAPSSSGLDMKWTFYAGSPTCDFGQPGLSNLNCVQTHGYPYCAPFNTGETDWGDNYLCFNQNVNPTIGTAPDGRDCTKMDEDSDPNGSWVSGYYVCVNYKTPASPGTPAQPATVRSPLSCSNTPGVNPKAGPTCAAEVFRFSPEIYLSNPGGPCSSNCGGGTPPAQVITSLPPEL